MNQIHKSIGSKREIRHGMYNENAKQMIGDIKPGFEMFGLTKGQFSIINVIEHILKQTGPADVIISTWTAANAEIKKAENFLSNGNINNLHWIVDRSFKTRQVKYYNILIDGFGLKAISETDSHAKFTLIHNDSWHIVIRTSMNLNENKRLEFFEVSDSEPLYNYLYSICSDIMVGGSYSWDKFKKLGQDEKYNRYRKINNSSGLHIDFNDIKKPAGMD